MEFASVYLRERGHYLNAEAGYFFSIEKNSSISGFFILGGVGYLRHKVRIVDEFNAVVQLFDPYDRGYDRLTGGWSITQKVGYQFLSKDKLVNLRISAALTEGFTKDVRKFNYNKTESKSSRTDILASLQIAWIVPIYLTKEIRYY